MDLTYDSIVDTYKRLAVPLVFMRPAVDLLNALRLSVYTHILDVGAGAGVTGLALQEIGGFSGRLVEFDISLEMLKASESISNTSKVVGEVPGLPFCSESFDAVMSNFVMSHVKEYREALADMVRVLKSGGKIGIASWGNGENEYSELWNETAISFVDENQLEKIVDEFMPSRKIFTNPETTKKLLEEAGATNIEIQKSDSIIITKIANYIEMKNVMLQGRFIRSILGEGGWQDYLTALNKKFRDEFRDPIEYPSLAHLVIGSKP